MPAGLIAVQNFVVHIKHFLRNVYKSGAIFLLYRDPTLFRWYDNRRDRFYGTNFEALSAVDTSV